jgi:hypothetical protein
MALLLERSLAAERCKKCGNREEFRRAVRAYPGASLNGVSQVVLRGNPGFHKLKITISSEKFNNNTKLYYIKITSPSIISKVTRLQFVKLRNLGSIPSKGIPYR